MSFVILSTGTLAGSTLRTIRTRSILWVVALAMVAVLAGGFAVGYRIGQSGQAQGALQAAGLDADGPESRALIDRVGSLSGRLIRLETEAVSLARQVGAVKDNAQNRDGLAAMPAPRMDATDGPASDADPSGGPFVAAGGLPVPGFMTSGGAGFARRLAQLAVDLDRIEATFARVAQVASVRNLDSMAFPSRLPLDSATITSGFGTRLDPFTQRLARHTGLDFRSPFGAPILASAGGRVRFAGFRGAYGNTVEIDHGDGLATRYGHASRLYVHPGEIVLPGQRIAAVGSTGRSTGPHLHFEVLRNGIPVEPRLYLARDSS